MKRVVPITAMIQYEERLARLRQDENCGLITTDDYIRLAKEAGEAMKATAFDMSDEAWEEMQRQGRLARNPPEVKPS